MLPVRSPRSSRPSVDNASVVANQSVIASPASPRAERPVRAVFVMKGFLTKRSPGALTVSTTRRFFALRVDGMLAYFEDEEAPRPRGVINLRERGVQILVGLACALKGPWSTSADSAARLQIATRARVYYLEADTAREALAWGTALVDITTVPPMASFGDSDGPITEHAVAVDAVVQNLKDLAAKEAEEKAKALDRAQSMALNVTAVVTKLEFLQLPAVPSKGRMVLGDLFDIALSVAKETLLGLVSHAVIALPCGQVAVALCTAISDRLSLHVVNVEQAVKLRKLAGKIAHRGDAVLAHFRQTGDEEGLADAEELLGHTFCAFRLAVEIAGSSTPAGGKARKGARSRVFMFFGAKTAAQALTMAHQELLWAVMVVTFLGVFEPVGRLRAFEPHVLRGVPACNAAEFWVRHDFGAVVSVQILLDKLQVEAAEAGILPSALDGRSLADVDELYLFFATKRNFETTTVDRFAQFLGQSRSVAQALMGPLARVARVGEVDESIVITESTTSSEAGLPSASGTVSSPPHLAVAPAPPPSTVIVSPLKRAPTLTSHEVLRRQILQPVEFGADLVRHQAAYVMGTREWLFTAVEEWAALPAEHPNRRAFWVQGSAGLGKSVVAAQLIKRYGDQRESPHNSLPFIGAHFFCQHDDQARSNPRRVVATLAFRLAAQLPHVAAVYDALLEQPALRAVFLSHIIGEQHSLDDMFETVLAGPLRMALLGTAQNMPSPDVLILIDALDELEAGAARTALLSLMAHKLCTLPPSVRLVVTSRPESDIVRALACYNPLVLARHDLEQRNDLAIYLYGAVVLQTNLSRLSKEQQDEIVVLMQEQADGVFLAARLVAESLVQAFKDTQIPLSIDNVRDAFAVRGERLVDSFYTATLERIRQQLHSRSGGDPDVLVELQTALSRTLSVLVAALVPPCLGELAILCGGVSGPQSGAVTRGLLNALSLMFAASHVDGPVQPLHKSVFDYLRDPARSGPHHISVDDGHAVLTMSCLRLQQPLLHSNAPRASSEPVRGGRSLVRRGSLNSLIGPTAEKDALTYAAEHAPTHLAHCVVASGRSLACRAAEEAWLAAMYTGNNDNDRDNESEDIADAQLSAEAPAKASSVADVSLPGETAGSLLSITGSRLYHRGAFKLSCAYFERAVFVLSQTPGKRRELADTLVALGRAADSAADTERALAVLAEAADIFASLGLADSSDMARLWHTLALVHQSRGSHELALEYFQKALSLQLALFGDDHPDTGSTFNNMGMVHHMRGDFGQALTSFQRALEILMATRGERHPDTAATLANLANIYDAQGETAQALDTYAKALAIQQVVLGENHPDTAATYNNMAIVCEKQGDFAAALDMYGKALAIKQAVLGDNHPGTANTLYNMASLCCMKSEFDAAVEHYQKALAIQQAALGEKHADTIATVHAMAGAYMRRGRHERALELYQKALAQRIAALGPVHPDVANTYHGIGALFLRRTRFDRALEFFNKGLEIRTAVFGDQHIETAASYQALASVYQRRGELGLALTFFNKALAIRLAHFGGQHPATAATYHGLANVYKMKGDVVLADEMRAKVFHDVLDDSVAGADGP